MYLLSLQVTYPKTDEQRQRLQEACKDILLFKNLDQVKTFFYCSLFCFVSCHLIIMFSIVYKDMLDRNMLVKVLKHQLTDKSGSVIPQLTFYVG